MKRTVLAAMSTVLCAAMVLTSGVGDVWANDDSEVLEPMTFGSLTLLPIVAKSPDESVDYIVLDEGMKKKKLKITEVSKDGEVNELLIANQSSQPLFLMSGEVIIGGKQDRIIGKTMVVPAKSKQKVPVFCVEQGRWAGRKASFESTGALAHKSLRTKASFKDQSAVWKEVKSKNRKRNTDNRTGTYRGVATGKAVKDSVKGFKNHFGKAIRKLPAAKRTKHVGYAVALNGAVVSVEVFGSSKLFKKLESKLLQSYFVEAVDVAKNKNAKNARASQVRDFRKKGKAARPKALKVVEGRGAADAADTYQFEEGELKGSVVEKKDDADAPAVYEGIF